VGVLLDSLRIAQHVLEFLGGARPEGPIAVSSNEVPIGFPKSSR
jgi:hypothetical protein